MKWLALIALVGLGACAQQPMTPQQQAQWQQQNQFLMQYGLQMYQLGQPYTLPSGGHQWIQPVCHQYGNGTTSCLGD